MKKSLFVLIVVLKFAFCDENLAKWSFDDLLSKSMENFPNIQIKKFDQEQALADLKYARAEFFPRIYLSLNSEYAQKFDDNYYKSSYVGDESIISSTGYQNSASIVLRYDIFRFWQDKYKYDAAKKKVSYSVYDKCDYELNLALELLEIYRKTIDFKHQIWINSQIYEYYEILLSFAKRLNLAGLASKTDILQYEMTLDNLKIKLLNLAQESEFVLSEIEFLSGAKINDINELADFSDSFDDFGLLEFDDTFGAKKLQDEIMQKEFLLKSAKNSYFPNISLYAKYDFYGDDDEIGKSYKQTKKHGYKVGINFSLDLFDGGRKSAQIKSAQIELIKAKLNQELAKKQYEKDVQNIKSFIAKSTQTRQNLQKLYDDSTKSLQMANRLNQNSQISKTEVIKSQIENLQNLLSLNEYQNTLNYNIKKANLMSRRSCE